jgi:hypothetical protein
MRFLLVAAVLISPALCQQAQIAGLIRDPAGLNVRGAEISVRNEETGGRRQTLTNNSGFYSVASLNPGTYRILVRSPGFETIVQERLQLEVGDNARLDFTLRLGDSRTIVTVEGGHPLINMEDASIGTVIGRDIIDEMPLNGRGIQSLIELTPGVEAVSVTPDNAGQISVNGQRSVSNYFTVDGVSANFGAGVVSDLNSVSVGVSISQAGGAQLPANNLMGTFSNLVSPDALLEFRIQTSTFAPEFGRMPGAQIGLITRSGTNRYSGSLFEYFRNNAFDANDWFYNRAGAPKAPLRFNNFGGTLGGPVRMPRLHRAADDRTFFFFSFEDLVMRQPQPTESFGVPTAQTRLSASPLSAPIDAALPLPNRPPSALQASQGWAGFVRTFSAPTDQQTWGLRIDHYFSDKLIGFFRYNQAPSRRTEGGAYREPLTLFRSSAWTSMLTAGVTKSVSPAFVNEVRANLSRQNVNADTTYLSLNGASPFPVNLLFPPGYSPQNSNIVIEDYSNPATPEIELGLLATSRSRQIQIVDQLSYTRGTHQFKFGADYRMFNLLYKPPKAASTFTFTDLPQGQLLDIEEVVTPADLAYRVPAFSLYAQDTWHILRRLTITYGVRWELEPAPRATSGDISVYNVTNLADLSNLAAAPRGSPFYRTQYANFAPRIGLAWQMRERGNQKTVLRAGAGLFYDSAQGWFENLSADANETRFFGQPSLNVLSSGAQPDFVVRSWLTVAAAPGYTRPRTYEWNVTLEQSFGQQTRSVAYASALGRRLLGTVSGESTGLHLDLSISGNYFSSSYNALQLQFNRRMSKRVQALLSYTWSHSLDNLSDQSGDSLGPLDTSVFFHPDRNRGDSDFDIRQSFHGALFATIPAPRRGRSAILLRNWTASTIFFARTSLTTNLLAYTATGLKLRPNLVPGQPLYLYGGEYPGGKSINPAAFMPVSGAEQGDLGRNVLRGLGAWQADLALHRKFRLSEHTTVQFRGEAFNVFNHPNFANLGGNGQVPQQAIWYSSYFGYAANSLAAGLSPRGTLGQLNQLFQIGGPRSLQLALRLTF